MKYPRCHNMRAPWSLVLLLVSFGIQAYGLYVSMTSEGHVYLQPPGSQLTLECNFHADEYDLFLFPVSWKKQQLAEECQVNVMSSINEPFFSTGKFEVSYSSHASRYRFTLAIFDLQVNDSANYSCEIRDPRSQVLARITHQVFVTSPISTLNLSITSSNRTSSFLKDVHAPLHRSPVTLMEDVPVVISCLSKGGYPAPHLSIQINRSRTLHPLISSARRSTNATGNECFRLMKMTSEVKVNKFVPTFKDDEAFVNCSANVPGLSSEVHLFQISVNYAPKISCQASGGYVGERNSHVTCEISAKPRLTDLYWLLDSSNQTIVREGKEVHEHYTVTKEKSNGRTEATLFIRKVKVESFRSYVLAAENPVSVTRKSVDFYQKFRPTTEQPQSDDRSRFSNLRLGYQGPLKQTVARSNAVGQYPPWSPAQSSLIVAGFSGNFSIVFVVVVVAFWLSTNHPERCRISS